MKKLLALILSIFLSISFSGCFIENTSLFYTEFTERNGFNIAKNNIAKCCFVASFNNNEYTNYIEISIPDACDEIPIKQIGGYYGRGVPSPFYISLTESHMNAPEDREYNAIFSGDITNFEISEEYTIENVICNLNIGKNIENITYVSMDVYFPHINTDGSITFFHPVVYITCSENNKNFYSENGKLYNKSNSTLINDFAYID